MEMLTKEIQIAADPYKLGKALASIAIAAELALKDGVQASDIPLMVSAFISKDVVEGLAAMSKLKAEFAENKALVLEGLGAAMVELAEELSK